jgi:hypothetical protein
MLSSLNILSISKTKSFGFTMDNLHVRLNFDLSEEKGITNITAKKNIMKLVKLKNLVGKCCKAWKI